MEPDTPVKGRKSAAKAKPKARKGLDASASASAHVIDLRQHSKPTLAPVSPPEPKPAKKAKPAPQPVKTEVESEAKPDDAPFVQPIAPQPDDLVPGDTVDIVKVQSGRKRFWGAFIRFILLLILLAAVVFGGVYMYLTLYHQG